MTTARYYPPSGRNIHRTDDSKAEDEWGVRPDAGWELELNEEERKAVFNRWRIRGSGPKAIKENAKGDSDPQLEKAIEAIRKQWKAQESDSNDRKG